MVFEPRILSPRHARRARLCKATRKIRRDIAKSRVRGPLQEQENILQENESHAHVVRGGRVYLCGRSQTRHPFQEITNDLQLGEKSKVSKNHIFTSVINHSTIEPSQPNVEGQGEVWRSSQSNGSNIPRFCIFDKTLNSENIDEDNNDVQLGEGCADVNNQYDPPRLVQSEPEVEYLDEDLCNEMHSSEIHTAYAVADYARVERGCLSICYMYPNEHALIDPAFLPLHFGKCFTHDLGDLEYMCENCAALCWKSEGKSIRNFVGKYCCASGKVRLQPLLDVPKELQDLMHGETSASKNFLKNIRGYNNSLAFASLGAHVDERFIRGRGVYTFRVHGQTYHNIGPLMPTGDPIPRFAQLYFYDTEHELQNRLYHVANIEERTLKVLQNMMHRVNPYAEAFRSVGRMLDTMNTSNISMVITENRANGWQYLAPRGAEVAAIMPGQGDERTIGHRDILINLRDGGLRRISNVHRSYMPLLYVLLFPRGEDGWHSSLGPTQMEYYSYRLQVRDDTIGCLLRGGRLFQQYVVDAFSSMEESRLLWMRRNQQVIRADLYKGLVDMVETRDATNRAVGRDAGRRVVLPSSFVGGPRYMHQLYQDSMAIVRKKGKPDLFITFTCNPNWREIKDALLPGQQTIDRPDLVSRVFYQKFKDIMHLLTKMAIFGDVVGHVSVIEFQKRGLPHAHILLILGSRFKTSELGDYDKLVCAELPDREKFPELFDIICRCNVHGPCGAHNSRSPCMIDGRCRFKFPRRFSTSTMLDNNGYPTYMRRDNGRCIIANGKRVDNQWIVPYNPFLSMRYKAHINVEICSTISAVKYLYKYLYKGHDRATIVIQDDADGAVDEIKTYLDARYVSSSEALWRIYGFDLHQEKPDVQRLQIHLPNENNVHFRDTDDLREVIENDNNKKTTLTEWFVTNQNDVSANDLLYIDFPERWVWNKTGKRWTARQRGNCIGRMYNIVPTAGDLYFLRMLLTICKGCKSFEDVRTFNGCTYPTFKDACNARGMLQSDDEWMMCLEEACFVNGGGQLRQLFAIILVYCMPVSPEKLWDRFWVELSDDHFCALRNRGYDVRIGNEVAKNQTLASLDAILAVHGKSLCNYPGMPQIDRTHLHSVENNLLAEEMMFDVDEQLNIALRMEEALNEGQKSAYCKVLQAIEQNKASVFFLDGPGGSGKTFVYNALLSRVRAQQKIALACASSGIAALLLSNGRTAHSQFKIPIEIKSESTCNIKVTSHHAELLRRASLVVWDEAPMTDRRAFEAVDRTLRDVMQNETLFGGKVMLFGGDFRQVLPVVPKGRREDIIDASLCRSFIWRHTEILRLTENMRLVNSNTVESERDFAKWILDIGNGNGCASNGNDDMVILPATMLLSQNCVQSLIGFIYADVLRTQDFSSFFRERGILAPKNKDVDVINCLALCMLEGESREYLSADSICSSDEQTLHLYTLEFLNSIDLGGGFPPYKLSLKQNAPVILLRNLDPRRGLCNGTRLICRQLYDRVIEAKIITGKNAGDMVFIPRIDFISSSSLGLPFEMKRRQFPIKLAFGMTINKAQGQTLEILGLYLASPVFSHGQLYVAMSRVKSSNAIKIVVDDRKLERQNGTGTVARTLNIVFKEMEIQRAFSYVVGQNSNFVEDPFCWRGSVSADRLVQIFEHSNILRQCFQFLHVFIGVYKLSWYHGMWITYSRGYYHVALSCNDETNQVTATVWFVGYELPINVTRRFVGAHGRFRVRVYTQVDTPERVYQYSREFGPWTFRVPNEVSRRLMF